jgi:uncharacterized protein (DUF362 family)
MPATNHNCGAAGHPHVPEGAACLDATVMVGRLPSVYPCADQAEAGHPLSSVSRALFLAWGKNPDDPFAGLVLPGGKVVIKPNWVAHSGPGRSPVECLVTHTSVIALAMRWAAVALKGRGSVVVGDAPLQGCDFQELLRQTGMVTLLADFRRRYPSIRWACEDWRLTTMDDFEADDLPSARAAQTQQPSQDGDFQLCDLAQGSFLEEISDRADRFRVSCYRPSLMRAHHQPGRHEYLVARRVLEADLVVNLPKWKTHMKAGLTGALKNLVGINGHKEYLPHYVQGGQAEQGDCYQVTNPFKTRHDRVYDRYWEHYAQTPVWQRWWQRQVMRGWSRLARWTGADIVPPGGWPGNDTLWRMTLDLNHLLYGRQGGPRIITLVDGVIAGEGDGPLRATPLPAGVLVMGENPAAIDAVLAAFMGYDGQKIPTVKHALGHPRSLFATAAAGVPVQLLHEGEREPRPVRLADLPNLHFRKPRLWHELERT